MILQQIECINVSEPQGYMFILLVQKISCFVGKNNQKIFLIRIHFTDEKKNTENIVFMSFRVGFSFKYFIGSEVCRQRCR